MSFQLFEIGVIPVLASVVLYFLFNSKKLKDVKRIYKQIFAGLVFACIAIVATEFGVDYYGEAIINVRDGAVLCAALIFGGPAGLIAGMIAAIERWFCVLWGGGMYTRLACTVSTFLAGLIGTGIRNKLFDDQMVDFSQAFIFTAVIEIIHMSMIFLTNRNDIRMAFTFVEACTIPMVLINSLTVAVAVFLIRSFEETDKETIRSRTSSISEQVQKWLIVIMLAGFLITLSFNLLLHNSVADEDIKTMLAINIDDAVNDVVQEADRYIIRDIRNIRTEIADDEEYELDWISTVHNVSEINLIDEFGIIYDSTNTFYIGYDMKENTYTREFLRLLNGEQLVIQGLRSNALNVFENKKYAGIRMNPGFLEIAYDINQYHELLAESLPDLTLNRHIGETGKLIVVDETGWIVSESDGYTGRISDYGITTSADESMEFVVYEGRLNGEKIYYMYTVSEGYGIIGVYPADEADFSKRLSIYLSVFMETIVFGLLYAAIYDLLKNGVLNNIISVNHSLDKITKGDLDTVVDVRSNKEFVSLSEGINSTVSKLKSLIKEANERIDSELRYAEEIQESALPSIFPPYPDRYEFDIYALMDPARQVGGDFYDFYMIDDDTLVFLVADVSGKGIPASLFMMRAKTTIKDLAESGVDVADIFTNTNYQLCEGNDAGMFVTSWMGFLNLSDGRLRYVNAGHNKPLLKRKDGRYEFLDSPAGFILGGMEGITYKKQELYLEEGDELFLYTDGVVEATDVEKKLYGNQRLENCLNEHLGEDAKSICIHVKEDVDAFYEGAEQFDDITELSLRFLKYTKK